MLRLLICRVGGRGGANRSANREVAGGGGGASVAADGVDRDALVDLGLGVALGAPAGAGARAAACDTAALGPLSTALTAAFVAVLAAGLGEAAVFNGVGGAFRDAEVAADFAGGGGAGGAATFLVTGLAFASVAVLAVEAAFFAAAGGLDLAGTGAPTDFLAGVF